MTRTLNFLKGQCPGLLIRCNMDTLPTSLAILQGIIFVDQGEFDNEDGGLEGLREYHQDLQDKSEELEDDVQEDNHEDYPEVNHWDNQHEMSTEF